MYSNYADHIPVLRDEVIAALNPTEGDVVVDATAGAGGHAREIAKRIGANGKLILIDRDPNALGIAKNSLNKYSNLCTFTQGNYDSISDILEKNGIQKVDIILADLGISSMQIDNAHRGFSYDQDGPLKMTMNPDQKGDASELVNNASQAELETIFMKYGEENPKNARLVAKTIVSERQKGRIQSTRQLNDLLDKTLKATKKRPAIRIFQALRIAVNDELGSLERFLRQAPKLLTENGKLGIITFHSLEDRIVKNFFKDGSSKEIKAKDGTRYPKDPIFVDVKKVLPSKDEIDQNPRSRSAIFRSGTRV